jgi:hypothetical protein
MPRVLDAHVMLEHAWSYLCAVETDINRALTNCDHCDLLPNLVGCQALYGPVDKATMTFVRDEASVVVTPVFRFHTRTQLEQIMIELPKVFLDQLKPLKPKAIGNLWVACSVAPGSMCYELVLAIPFSKEK